MTTTITRLLVSATFVILAALALQPSTVFAQAGACGGQVITGLDNSCAYTYSQCAPFYRVVENGQGPAECPRNSGDYYWVPSQTCQYSLSCQYPTPAITFTSNPVNPVIRDSMVTLNWSATNATSCSSADFTVPGGATSGSVSVTANYASKDYTITCTNQGQTSSNGYLTITTRLAPLDGGCSVSPTTAQVGQNVRWTAWASGGQTPYSFTWLGQLLDGLTGTSVQVAYDTVGTKTASIQIKDSNATAASYSLSEFDHQVCTGPTVASNIIGTLEEDGGTYSDMVNLMYQYMEGVYYGAEGFPYDQGYRSTYNAVAAAPQNYCIYGRLKQACNPPLNWAGCNWSFEVDIRSGSGLRAENGTTDQGPFVGSWNQTRFNGSMTATYSAASTGQTITRACTNSVNVTANAPTATLSANPVSIIAGQSSTLTWSSTNAGQCTSPDFTVPGNAISGTATVSPAATKTYTITCTGAGGSANSSATVTVTPVLSASCAVSPASVTMGSSATWTATPTGGNGVYAYTWGGGDGLSGSTAQVSHTYNTPGGPYTGNVTVTSGGQSVGPITCSNSVTVTGKPNLTAGAITPTSATAGTAVTLSAAISNAGGSASTGAGFTDLFQRASDAAGSNAVDIGTYASAAIAAGSSNTASRTYTFPGSDGGTTVYVRACADKASAGDTGVITELSEGDNCGAWTAVAVAYSSPPAVSCVASPASIGLGSTVTFTATPSFGATGPYTWKDSDGWTTSSGGTTATRTYTSPPVPPAGGVYQMSVKASNTGYFTCSNQVTINTPYCAGPADANISANPTRVKEGQTSTITWSATNVGGVGAFCTVKGPNGTIVTQNAGTKPSCSITGGNSVQTINQQSTFTIICSDGAEKSVTVNVVPKFEEF